jgi:hypothetical protein
MAQPPYIIDFPDEQGLVTEAKPRKTSDSKASSEAPSISTTGGSTSSISPTASLELHYEDGCCLSLKSDKVPLLSYHPHSIPLDARRLWTDAERQYFYNHPFSLRSVKLMLRGVRLWGGRSEAPAGTFTRNISLTVGYALGFGQNTSKWLAGDRIPFNAILDESRDNILAVLPAVGLFKRARTIFQMERTVQMERMLQMQRLREMERVLQMEREAMAIPRTFTATHPFEPELSAIADEMLEALEAGRMDSAALVKLHPYQGARQAKIRMGVFKKGTHEAAHAGPQALMKGVPQYSAKHVLTRTLPVNVHRSIDVYWNRMLTTMRARGQTTMTAQEMYRMVSDSIRRSPMLSASEKQTHIAHLSDELFVQLGLKEFSLISIVP